MSRLNILDAVSLVQDSVSSIFSKDDVLKLLNNIDADLPTDPIAPQFTASESSTEETVTLTRTELEEFAQSVADDVSEKLEYECQGWMDQCAMDADVEFSLDGDRIVVQEIRFSDEPDMRLDTNYYADRIDELFERKNGN